MIACTVAPKGWVCTRAAGHDGPCAAVPQAQDTAKLAVMSAKATPGLWEVDDEFDGDAEFSGSYGQGGRGFHDFIIGAAVDGKWATLFGTRDSNVKLIDEDYDEDYHRAWDSVGEANAKFAVACVNYVRAMLAAREQQS